MALPAIIALRNRVEPEPPEPTHELNDSIVSYYDYGGIDRAGSNNLTGVGNSSTVPGTGVGIVSGTCARFDQANVQYYERADASAGDFESQTMTLALWYKAFDTGSTQRLWGKGSNYRGAFVTSSGDFTHTHGATQTKVGTSFGVWNHVAFTYDSGTSELKFYFNGVLIDTDTTAGPGNTPEDFRLGNSESGSLSFNGLMDQAVVWHRVLSLENIEDLYNNGFGYDFLGRAPVHALNGNLLVYYRGHGVDLTHNEPDLTAAPNIRPDAGDGFIDSQPGEAMDFDGTNQHYSVTGGNLANIFEPADGGKIKTYQFWVYNRTDASSKSLLSRGTASSGFNLYVQHSEELVLYQHYGYVVAGKLTENAWNHVIYRYDNGSVSLFVNGVETTGTANRAVVANAIYLGRGFSGPVRYFDGQIDHVAVWDKWLSDTEVADLYNSGAGLEFVDGKYADSRSRSLFDGLEVLLNEDHEDQTNENDNFTVQTGTIDTATGKVNANAINMTPTARLQLAHADAGIIDLLSSQSIAFWIYSDTTFGSYPAVMGKTTGTYWRAYINPSGTLTLNYGATALTTTETLSASTWHHIAVTYDWTSKMAAIYIDGVRAVGVASTVTSTTENFFLGSTTGTYTPTFDGRFDQVGIWNRLLEPGDVKKLVNGGSGLADTEIL